MYSINGYGLDSTAEPGHGLSNGDVVTLTLSAPNGEDLEDYCQEHYGFTPVSGSSEYTVDTLAEARTEPTEAVYDYEALVADYSAVIRGHIPIDQVGMDLSRPALHVTPAGCTINAVIDLVDDRLQQNCSREGCDLQQLLPVDPGQAKPLLQHQLRIQNGRSQDEQGDRKIDHGYRNRAKAQIEHQDNQEKMQDMLDCAQSVAEQVPGISLYAAREHICEHMNGSIGDQHEKHLLCSLNL